jgi:prostatic aicd phosphatase
LAHASDFPVYPLVGAPCSDNDIRSQPYEFNTLSDWCTLCNTDSNGCDTIADAALATSPASPDSTVGRQRVSPLGSGFIGAGITLALVLAVLGALAYFRLASFGKKARRQATVTDTVYDGGFHSDRKTASVSVAEFLPTPCS